MAPVTVRYIGAVHKGDLYAFRSYLLSRDVNLAFNVETATTRLESRGTSIFITGRVRKDLAGTAWEARLRPVDIGTRPPRLAEIEIYRLGTSEEPGARPGGGTE